MTGNTRRFVIGSTVVLTVGLVTGLVAYYGGLPTGAFGRQSGPAELAYVPGDAAVVAYADVRELMDSELRQKLRAVLPQEKGRDEFKQQTGVDVEHDIDAVLACMLPGQGQERGFAVMRGRFDTVRLEALAREHNASVTEYKGKRMLALGKGDAAGKGHPPVLAFLEPGLLMFGDDGSIRRAIDTHTSGQNMTDNGEVMRLIKDLDGTANAWAVGRFDVLASHAKLPEGMASQIPAVSWFTAAGHINGGVQGVVKAEARDEQAAKNLRDVINGFLALARLQAGNKPEMQTLMQSVNLGGSGKTVELSFTLPNEFIDMIPNLKSHARTRDGELE